MKLLASIKPRHDGTVTYKGPDEKAYVFKVGADGALVGDVEDEATALHLLSTGLFEPFDEEGFAVALAAAREREKQADSDDDYDHDEDYAPDQTAPPLEALTPPSNRKPGKPRKG